jgi:hypothetical protein
MSKTATKGDRKSDVTEVAHNSIWRERVKSELQTFELNEQFTAHPLKSKICCHLTSSECCY